MESQGGTRPPEASRGKNVGFAPDPSKRAGPGQTKKNLYWQPTVIKKRKKDGGCTSGVEPGVEREGVSADLVQRLVFRCWGSGFKV